MPSRKPVACYGFRWRFTPMGIDFGLIAGFVSLGLIFIAGPAVIFIIFARRGAL